MGKKKKVGGGTGGGGKGQGPGKGIDPDPVPFTMFRYRNNSSVPAKANVTIKPTYPKKAPPISFPIPPSGYLGPGQETYQSFVNVFNVVQVSGTVTCYVPGSSPEYPTHGFDSGDTGRVYIKTAEATTTSTANTDLIFTT